MTPEEMLKYATRFTFPTSIVGFTKVTVEPFHDYWVIRAGERTRYDKKLELFVYPDEDVSNTKFTLEEAVELASSMDLYKEHMDKVRGMK